MGLLQNLAHFLVELADGIGCVPDALLSRCGRYFTHCEYDGCDWESAPCLEVDQALKAYDTHLEDDHGQK